MVYTSTVYEPDVDGFKIPALEDIWRLNSLSAAKVFGTGTAIVLLFRTVGFTLGFVPPTKTFDLEIVPGTNVLSGKVITTESSFAVVNSLAVPGLMLKV